MVSEFILNQYHTRVLDQTPSFNYILYMFKIKKKPKGKISLSIVFNYIKKSSKLGAGKSPKK